MNRGAKLALWTFLIIWVPLSVWRGLAMGRSFRIGHQDADHTGPLIDAIVQIAFVMLAPALFAALAVFVFWAWREERRSS